MGRLKLHVTAVFIPLQLHHNQVGFLVDSQQIDPSFAVLPLFKLFGDDEHVR